MRKERFPSKHKSSSDRPFKILEKIGPNAYKVDLSGEYRVSSTFNMTDLSPCYDEDEEFPSLGPNSKQTRRYDGGHPLETCKDYTTSPHGVTSVKKV